MIVQFFQFLNTAVTLFDNQIMAKAINYYNLEVAIKIIYIFIYLLHRISLQ